MCYTVNKVLLLLPVLPDCFGQKEPKTLSKAPIWPKIGQMLKILLFIAFLLPKFYQNPINFNILGKNLKNLKK